MGKKRVITEGTKAKGSGESDFVKRKIRGRKLTNARVYVQSTYNNTIVTMTTPTGDPVATVSSGMLGFRGPKRSTPYAASQVAKALYDKVSASGVKEIEVYVKGIGAGREAVIRALANEGLDVTFIKDITPIPHNGPRAPRPRRN
ncbi:MAG: Ribosomal protein S11 [Parcubacteria group bacterium GW2011_GWA2_47_8]|nr:MAG: Ribosomal protein S11 [Parcubacteria group bacterium GW2011_GWA2_47_8]